MIFYYINITLFILYDNKYYYNYNQYRSIPEEVYGSNIHAVPHFM